MVLQDVLIWIKNDFGYLVPEDYQNFLKTGDFKSTLRKYHVIDLESESVLEISQWYDYDNISSVYTNCRNEKMIERYHLPILDSCGCTVVLDCNPQNESYGQVFSRTPTGYYDESLQENVYLELDLVATSFSDLINDLKSVEELEDMGVL